jgi:TolB protein
LTVALVAVALSGGRTPARVRTIAPPRVPTVTVPAPGTDGATGQTGGAIVPSAPPAISGSGQDFPAPPPPPGPAGALLPALRPSLPLARQQLAFSRVVGEPGDIYVLNGDGSGLVAVTHNIAAGSTVRDLLPAISPDGKRIAFASDRDNPQRTTHYWSELYVMDVDGSHVRRMLHSPLSGSGATSPAWSPDGRNILFLDGDDRTAGIWTVDVDTTKTRVLTSGPAREADYAPAWSPDGRRIAFSHGIGELWLMDRSGGHRRRVLDHDGTAPSWAPDNRTVVVFAQSQNQVQTVDTESGQKRLITSGNAEHRDPSWSGDGNWIAYSYDADKRYDPRNVDPTGLPSLNAAGLGGGPLPAQIHLVRPDGTGDHALTSPPVSAQAANDTEPTWGPARATAQP